MRKFIRNKLRKEAEKLGVKASRYINREFDKYQIKKYGATVNKIHKAKGTHKRSTWKTRIASVVG